LNLAPSPLTVVVTGGRGFSAARRCFAAVTELNSRRAGMQSWRKAHH
jgi:hypothetical protein